MESNRHKKIQVLAFLIWEKNGCGDGRAIDHWLEAEYLVSTNSLVNEEPVAELDGVGEMAARAAR